MRRIIFIEDDKLLNQGISLGLKREGYQVTSGFSVKDAYEIVNSGEQFDLLLLDANLPDGDGFKLCKDIRKKELFPIILLTARGMDCDIVCGLESGADDYIVKPVSLRVLIARIHVLLRRSKEKSLKIYKLKGFEFDFDKKIFIKNNVPLKLGRREQKLLYYLISNHNQPLSKEQIFDYVWSDELSFVENNALAVQIRRLREKIETNPADPEHIVNVYGVGYMWSD